MSDYRSSAPPPIFKNYFLNMQIIKTLNIYRMMFSFGLKTYSSAAERKRRPLRPVVYARHGRELMGCKSPVRESCQWLAH